MTRPRILVVDDLLTNRMLVKAALSGDGYELVEAADGEEALAALADQAFDLVILDFQMPGLSGMDVLTTIRQTWDALSLPVMIVSGDEESEAADDFIAAGANDFTRKPYHFSVLAARARTLTGYKRAVDDLRARGGGA